MVCAPFKEQIVVSRAVAVHIARLCAFLITTGFGVASNYWAGCGCSACEARQCPKNQYDNDNDFGDSLKFFRGLRNGCLVSIPMWA